MWRPSENMWHRHSSITFVLCVPVVKFNHDNTVASENFSWIIYTQRFYSDMMWFSLDPLSISSCDLVSIPVTIVTNYLIICIILFRSSKFWSLIALKATPLKHYLDICEQNSPSKIQNWGHNYDYPGVVSWNQNFKSDYVYNLIRKSEFFIKKNQNFNSDSVIQFVIWVSLR